MTEEDALTGQEGRRLRRSADYQFGAGAGAVLFPAEESLTVRRSSSGRPEQVHAAEGRLVTQGIDGRFRISPLAGQRLADAFPVPRHRVVVGNESVPYVREGRNAFAKFVRSVDEGLRPGDEVIVTHDGSLLGVGRAELSGNAMLDFETGMAVYVRHGVPEAADSSD
jgi:uncharacterized protein with predicted RNA binding PUA domain